MSKSWERFRRNTMHGNVVLNFTPYARGDLDVYGLAYREAADKLVEAFRSTRGYSDADACPIVFLYRQAVELYVKAIVLWGSGLVRLQSGEELNADKLLTTHEFSKLLPPLRRVFQEADWLHTTSESKFGTFDEIREFLLALDEVDPKASAFRYPVDTKGDPTVPEQFSFNIFAFAEEASELVKSLEGAATGIYEMFQTMASITHEYY